jgi:hypothetical protein
MSKKKTTVSLEAQIIAKSFEVLQDNKEITVIKTADVLKILEQDKITDLELFRTFSRLNNLLDDNITKSKSTV